MAVDKKLIEKINLKNENFNKELQEFVNLAAKELVDYSEKSSEIGKLGEIIPPNELKEKLLLKFPEDGIKNNSDFFTMYNRILNCSVSTWNPGFMDKLYASNNHIGVASDMLLSILNTNSHVYSVSPALSVIEMNTAKEYSKLFGFTSEFAGGITLPGGSASNIHSLTIARSTLFPETKTEGNGNKKFAIFTSKHSHYSLEKAAILCGLGSNSVFKIQTSKTGEMLADDLEKNILLSISQNYTPLYVNATAGTTVFGSFDPIEDIYKVSSKYKLWLHLDGSWGGNFIFSEKLKYKLKGSHLVNSITVNPHKMLGVPTTCSFLLTPDIRIFQKSNTLRAPYLFHDPVDLSEISWDLGDYTMGCGRRPDAVKLYLLWYYYGRKGLEKKIDLAYENTKYLAEKLSKHDNFHLVSENPPPCLQTCFYFSPNGQFENGEKNSFYTRKITTILQQKGLFLIDYSPSVDTTHKGDFFRVVMISPKVSKELIDLLVEEITSIGNSL